MTIKLDNFTDLADFLRNLSEYPAKADLDRAMKEGAEA